MTHQQAAQLVGVAWGALICLIVIAAVQLVRVLSE